LRPTLLQLLFTLTLYLIGCNRLPDSSKGFSLPQGNALAGVNIFLKYQCLACRCIEKLHYKTVNKELETPMHLGVTSTRVMTYADLITSIINPSHKMSSDYSLLSTQASGVSKNDSL